MKNAKHRKDKDKNWIPIVIVAIALFVVLFIFSPFLIDSVYKKGDITPRYYTKLSPSDILAYIGAFFSFAGTIGLSFLALWQNKKIEENNNEFQEIQETQFSKLLDIQMISNRPLLNAIVENDIFLEYNSSDNAYWGDFSYSLSRVSGNGYNFTSKCQRIYYFNQIKIKHILAKQDPTQGGIIGELPDKVQFIGNALSNKDNLLQDKISIGFMKEKIDLAEVVLVEVEISNIDIFQEMNKDIYYFAFSFDKKGLVLNYKNFTIRN